MQNSEDTLSNIIITCKREIINQKHVMGKYYIKFDNFSFICSATWHWTFRVAETKIWIIKCLHSTNFYLLLSFKISRIIFNSNMIKLYLKYFILNGQLFNSNNIYKTNIHTLVHACMATMASMALSMPNIFICHWTRHILPMKMEPDHGWMKLQVWPKSWLPNNFYSHYFLFLFFN